MSFSASDAAFEGFKVVRRNPLLVLFWAAVYLASFVAIFAVAGAPIAKLMASAEALQGNSNPSITELESLGQSYMMIIGLILPLGLIVGAVLNTAIARSVLRPADKSFGYMRLGADELRVFAVTVILGLLITVVWMGLILVVSIFGGLVSASGLPILWLFVIALGLAAIGVVVWLALRLSLAVPITFAEKRIALFDSFALTKGRVMPLLGMAVIAFIMAILVSLLGSIIAMPISLVTGGGLASLAQFEGQSMLQILQHAGLALVLWGVVNAIFSALQLAVMYAPFAAAYRDIKGLPVEG